MTDVRKMTGIAPAGPGWLAVYKDEPNNYAPVAAWVIGEDENDGQRVYGVEAVTGGRTELCETAKNFLEYIFCPGCFADGLCDKHSG